MSTQGTSRPLPATPDIRHLKDQAKKLLKGGDASSLADAQFQIARTYGFASWPKLKAHVDSLQEIGQLKAAIDANNVDRVIAMLTRRAELHQAPLGYRKNGPLTWVAECRVPTGPPSSTRLALARWMIENGSDVHQGGDGPLMRAALNGQRIPMMELLVSCGANVNALWNGTFPILFAPCETVDPAALKWLLDHGADPNCGKRGERCTALDYLIGSYVRSPRFTPCIDILLNAGGTTKYDFPPVLDLLRGRLDRCSEHLRAEPSVVHTRFSTLDFGATGARRLTLRGATLLHVAAEYGQVEAVRLLLEHGADINARAAVDDAGVGGQTPIFHAATQFGDWGLEVTRMLLERGADLTIRAKVPGHYERPDEFLECTPLEYAERFPEGPDSRSRALLREWSAMRRSSAGP
jgi:ankyrin repeat protein